MLKKGQLTIFVIIILLTLFVILGAYFLLQNTKIIKENQTHPEIDSFEGEIKDCLDQRLNDAIGLIGLGGGHISIENGIYTAFGEVSYAYKDNKEIMPSLEDIQEDIEDYIKTSVPACIELPPKISINQEDITSEVKIFEDDVKAIIEIPFTIKENKTTSNIEKTFKASVPVRLKKIHKVSSDIIKKQRKTGAVPLTFIASKQEYDLLYDFHEEDTIIYIVHDNKSNVNYNITYNFAFAVEAKE